MKTDERLLQFFAKHEGEYLSGETLAQTLNISRAAVWKVIQKLIDQGHRIDSQHRVGYRYQAGQILSAPIITELAKSNWKIRVLDSVNSTNTYAKETLAHDDITEPTMIIADYQTDGRGRLGRTFIAPPETGLYISFALPLPIGAAVIPGLLTTGTAVAVSRAIQKTLGIQLDFKWVNDLLFKGRKVGGILTEAVMDFESQQVSALVVGIGLNLLRPENLTGALANKIGGMVETLTVSRNIIVANVLDEFVTFYDAYTTGSFLPEYRERNIVIGQEVTIKYGRELLTGIAKDIGTEGQLLLDVGDKVITVNSGEVTKVNLPPNIYCG